MCAVILYALLTATIDGMSNGPITSAGLTVLDPYRKKVPYPIGNAYVNWYHGNKHLL